MAIIYEYNRGHWNIIEDPMRKVESTVSSLWKILREMGFLFETRIGKKDEPFSMEVYCHQDGSREGEYEYAICMGTNFNYVDTVYIPDLPSYLMFMREMAPLVMLNQAVEEEE